MTPLRFTYQQSELVAAMRAHYAAVRRKRGPAVLILLAGALVITALLVVTTPGMSLRDQGIAFGITLAALAIAIAVVRAGMNRVWIPRHVRRNFALHQDMHREITVSWDQNRLQTTMPTGQSNRPIGEFAFWLACPEMVMLYYSEISYFGIPARAFDSESQRDAFLSLVAQNGVKPR